MDNEPNIIINFEEEVEKILNMSVVERQKKNISRQKYRYWKKKAEKGKLVKINY